MKLKLALVILVCCSLNSAAQGVLQPLQSGSYSVGSIEHVMLRGAAAALPLPFFDDFTTPGTTPGSTYWQNGGAYINNRYGYEPISRKVATFDGLNAVGSPYAENSVGAGPSDTLTSQPILLGNLQPSDSVYLSFYWQSGGMGDVPDQTRENTFYLQLEFKDASGTWQQVWRQPAVGERTAFRQVFVGIKDARYFHNDFQFRFRNIGSRSGMADIWNIDYVELDKNRRKGQNKSQDFTISQGVTKLLKSYTAMPARQFLENPEAALNDSVWVTINKLGTLGAINWRAYIKLAAAARADTFLREQGIIRGDSRTILSGVPTVERVALPGEGFVLEHGFILNTSEQNVKQRANDTTSRKTIFADYYAFDDGTAEAGFNFISSAASHVAQRIDLQLPDHVRGFLVYFPEIRRNLSGTGLTFKIWANNNGRPGEVLHQQAFRIQHSETPDSLYEVTLTRDIPVSESFFYGWTQPANTYINIGFDRNEAASEERFLWSNVSGWQQDSLTQGAVMMRPLMSGRALGIEDGLPSENITLYPNPTQGDLYINGTYKRLSVYDLLGRQVHQHAYTGKEGPLNLAHLAGGVYFIRIETSESIITKKIILTL